MNQIWTIAHNEEWNQSCQGEIDMDKMDKSVVAGKAPILVDLKKGETYYYCTCGRSDNQPFCNGAHQGTSFAPMAFTAPKDEAAYLCACKHTKNPPYCDGSHKDL